MLNTENVPIVTGERKLPKGVDVRSVIIVGILAFGVGAYSTSDQPSYGSTAPTQSTPTTTPASSGK